jgi:hypothetical protein
MLLLVLDFSSTNLQRTKCLRWLLREQFVEFAELGVPLVLFRDMIERRT